MSHEKLYLCTVLSLANTGQGHDHSQAVFLDVASGLHMRIMATSRGQWLQHHCAVAVHISVSGLSDPQHVLLRVTRSRSMNST